MPSRSSEKRIRWLYAIPLLVLLLILGAAAYALNSAAAAAVPPGPAPVRPLGAIDFARGVDAAGLQPGEKVVLPNGVTVGRDAHHDLSPPLRDIPPVPVQPVHEAPENPIPLTKPAPSNVDTVVQRFFGPLAMPTPSLTFEGVSALTSLCGCLPPDTNGEAGPNHYVQTVNSAFEIWDKNGNVVQTARAINTLFSGFGGSCQTHNDGDPVVNYDQLADRWVISQFTSGAPFYQCVAVSQTGDPTGAYYRYAFLESNTDLYDYPKIGVWPDAYYMTANVFINAASYGFPAIIALDRTRMLQGLSATFQQVNPGGFYADVLPADLDGSTPPPAGAREPLLSASGNSNFLHLWNFHVDFTTPANSHLDGPTNLAAAPWDPNLCGGDRNCIPQPGTAVKLDSLFDHVMFRLAYRNFGDHESLVANESVDSNGQDLSGIRWYELRDPNGFPSIYQQGTYAPDSNNRWMGSIAQDRDGNIAVGYSLSSSTVFPSIAYAGRLATDPLGQLTQGEAILFAGGGSQTSASHRWGDYSDMTVDPSDDCTFWYTNEYHPTTSSATWHTRVGKFKFGTCGQITPTPTATGTPPTNTPLPTSTATPTTVPPACANYTYATATGTVVAGTQDIGIHCDDCGTFITMPFPVRLYDQTFSSGYVTSNGSLEFASSDFAYGNDCLPVPIYSYTIAAFWDDLTTTNAGQGIFSSTTGTAPNRVYNLEWRATSFASGTSENFEIRLYETPTGGAAAQFDLVYGVVTDIGSDTVGVQRNGLYATQFECNTAHLTTGMLLHFTLPPCPTATPGPATNTPVPPTATRTVPPTATNTTPPQPTNTTPPQATNTTPPQPTNTAVSATNTPGPPQPTETVCPISFSDVHPTDYFYVPVQYLYCRGVISGYGDNTFRPYNNTTRGQMVKIVILGFSKPIVTPTGTAYTFADVPRAAPFWSVIETAAAANIVSGYNCGGPGEPCDSQNRPYFRPNADVTRGQLSKIDVVAAGWDLQIPATPTFTDVPASNPFYPFVETAACHGVVSGYADHTFRPFADATRGQIAKIVYISLTSPGACGTR